MSNEPPQRPLTKKELKTLKNALGKQGITMEEHEAAQKLTEPAKILQIDCFALRQSTDQPEHQRQEENNPDAENQNLPDADGWYVGYGVAINGRGRLEGVPEEEDREGDEVSSWDYSGDEDSDNERAQDGESSGFESDPPTDEEEVVEAARRVEQRRESDDVSDKGQLLYGVDHQFYVDKALPAKHCTVHYGDQKESFQTGELVTTMRYPVAASSDAANTDDEFHHGYQMIGSVPCVTSHSEESEDEVDPLEDVTTSAGLWCNFVIAPEGFDDVTATSDGVIKKEQIPEAKLKTIPLDEEKLAQISAAMAGLQLPTPPGWEGVSDEKLLDFINQRI